MSTFYNSLLEKIILPMGDFYLGTAYMEKLNYWRNVQYRSLEDIMEIKRSHLDKLLTFASENDPFYKKLKIPIEPDPFKRIKLFPVMTKQIIKENLDSLIVKEKSHLIKIASSGTSGIQGEVYMEKFNQSMQMAVQTLWWEWAGYKLGDNILQTGITPKRGAVKSIKDVLLNTTYLPAFNLDEKEILKILREAQKKPKDFFMGYASSLFIYAKVAHENNINDVHFKSVVSWGDKMFPHFRTLIEKQFQTKVFDTYGCSEGFMIAGECEYHNYHISTPLLHLEIVDAQGAEVPIGELGNVVVTRLDNYAMPLIRYYLGDLATKEDPHIKCPCGRNLPLLKKIIGRDTDIVQTRSGKYMIVHAFTGIFEDIPEIRQFRVIQKNIDGIEIEYIKDNGFTGLIPDLIRNKIHNYLGEELPIVFREVEVIPPTPSGKAQIIQSFLKQSAAISNL